MSIRLCIVISILLSLLAPVRADQSLGDAIKKILSTPTPTPKPRKKNSASATKKKSPTPSPSKKSSPAREKESPTPSVTPLPKKKRGSSTEEELESPSPRPKKKTASTMVSPSASPHRKKKTSPTPEPFETPTGSTSPSEILSPTASPEESPPPSKKHGAPNATLSPDQIKGFENYPANVQKLLVFALALTTRNLDYRYGSADPANGGMDCSGFVYFVLKQSGIADVPRDSSEQYVWLRRARAFEAVLSEKDDSFELENLKPGDLLFWKGTYSIERDPPITHAMIYLGREKKNGQRVMVGASDGRVYQGESRNGVSVFDFKIQRGRADEKGQLRPTFVGYGHIPHLQE